MNWWLPPTHKDGARGAGLYLIVGSVVVVRMTIGGIVLRMRTGGIVLTTIKRVVVVVALGFGQKTVGGHGFVVVVTGAALVVGAVVVAVVGGTVVPTTTVTTGG